jgi:hypothetical protein
MSMKATFPVAAMAVLTALSACSRPSPAELTGDFETLSLRTIEAPKCVFRAADRMDDDEAVIFATYDGNLDHIAVTRYKGETINVTYEVIDYLNWQVRATSVDGIGQLELIQRGEPTEVASLMIGSCGN